MKAQFTFHPERCVGCGACVMACVNQNQIDVDERKPYRLLKVNEYADGDRIDIVYFTHGCMHCKDHPCANTCKKNCFSFDQSTGTVILNPETCVGCRACAKACPFDAIQFTRDRKAAKCNGCIQNLKRDRLPLCVMACPRQAITIDEKNDVLEEGRRSLKKELSEYRHRKGEAEENGTDNREKADFVCGGGSCAAFGACDAKGEQGTASAACGRRPGLRGGCECQI